MRHASIIIFWDIALVLDVQQVHKGSVLWWQAGLLLPVLQRLLEARDLLVALHLRDVILYRAHTRCIREGILRHGQRASVRSASRLPQQAQLLQPTLLPADKGHAHQMQRKQCMADLVLILSTS